MTRKRTSQLFDEASPSHDSHVSEDITALTQQLYIALDAENGLRKSRAGWVSTIPAGPLLRAAQLVIELTGGYGVHWPFAPQPDGPSSPISPKQASR